MRYEILGQLLDLVIKSSWLDDVWLDGVDPLLGMGNVVELCCYFPCTYDDVSIIEDLSCEWALDRCCLYHVECDCDCVMVENPVFNDDLVFC